MCQCSKLRINVFRAPHARMFFTPLQECSSRPQCKNVFHAPLQECFLQPLQECFLLPWKNVFHAPLQECFSRPLRDLLHVMRKWRVSTQLIREGWTAMVHTRTFLMPQCFFREGLWNEWPRQHFMKLSRLRDKILMVITDPHAPKKIVFLGCQFSYTSSLFKNAAWKRVKCGVNPCKLSIF